MYGNILKYATDKTIICWWIKILIMKQTRALYVRATQSFVNSHLLQWLSSCWQISSNINVCRWSFDSCFMFWSQSDDRDLWARDIMLRHALYGNRFCVVRCGPVGIVRCTAYVLFNNNMPLRLFKSLKYLGVMFDASYQLKVSHSL